MKKLCKKLIQEDNPKTDNTNSKPIEIVLEALEKHATKHLLKIENFVRLSWTNQNNSQRDV